MLRAAVLGCGAIGAGDPRHPDVGVATHAAAYAQDARTELVALCDPDPAALAAARGRWAPGATTGADPATVLTAARPELVSVCAPDATHAELVALALATPGVRGVLAEKPLAADAASARALVARAASGGVALAVNYTRRFAPAFAAARARVAAGALGALQYAHGAYVGGLRHNGTHLLDLLRMLLGEPSVLVAHDRLRAGGPDPGLDARLELPGGAVADVVALDARAHAHFELDVLGTEGRLRVESSGHVLRWWAARPDPRHPTQRALVETACDGAALRDAGACAVADLVTAVQTGRPPACTGADGVAALVLAETIAAAAAATTAAQPRHDGGR